MKKKSQIKLIGSITLAAALFMVLLAVVGQFSFSADKRKTNYDETVKVKSNNSPKYVFYDQLKQRKNELKSLPPMSEVSTIKLKKNKKYESYSYAIQVGVFNRESDTTKRKKQLEKLGYKVRIVKSSNNKYLVQIGPFSGKSRASKAQNSIENKKISTLLIRLKK